MKKFKSTISLRLIFYEHHLKQDLGLINYWWERTTGDIKGHLVHWNDCEEVFTPIIVLIERYSKNTETDKKKKKKEGFSIPWWNYLNSMLNPLDFSENYFNFSTIKNYFC